MKIRVTVVPTQGKSTTKDYEVPKTGATLGEVLKAAGIDGKNKDLTVNGSPATLDTHVKPDSKVSAKEKEKPAQVRVSERPQGS